MEDVQRGRAKNSKWYTVCVCMYGFSWIVMTVVLPVWLLLWLCAVVCYGCSPCRHPLHSRFTGSQRVAAQHSAVLAASPIITEVNKLGPGTQSSLESQPTAIFITLCSLISQNWLVFFPLSGAQGFQWTLLPPCSVLGVLGASWRFTVCYFTGLYFGSENTRPSGYVGLLDGGAPSDCK